MGQALLQGASAQSRQRDASSLGWSCEFIFVYFKKVAIGALDGIYEGWGDPFHIMVAVIDVHRYGDTSGVHGVDEVHIGIEGKVMVAYSYLPIDLLPGLNFFVAALADSKDGVVVVNYLLTPCCRRVEFEEFEWLGTLVATDVIDHTELLGMMYAIDRSSTSAHRKTSDGTSSLVGSCAVVLFDVGDQLLENIVFVFPVGRTESC